MTISLSEYENYYGQGLTLAESSRYEEAVQADDQAIAIKSDYHEAWYNRGTSLQR
jgi:tetratricopeptide (TPR) repeat protein